MNLRGLHKIIYTLYSSVFKKHHSISPAEFRKVVNTSFAPHPFFPVKTENHLTYEEYNQRITIQNLPDLLVIFERRIGNYIDLGKDWCDFTETYKEYITDETLLIERSYDDPSITSIHQCLYDVCMTVDESCTLENRTTIKGGEFAVFRFEGMVPEIYMAFQGIFTIWLPNSNYQMDERYGLDIYRAVDGETMHVVMDLCIPISLK